MSISKAEEEEEEEDEEEEDEEAEQSIVKRVPWGKKIFFADCSEEEDEVFEVNSLCLSLSSSRFSCRCFPFWYCSSTICFTWSKCHRIRPLALSSSSSLSEQGAEEEEEEDEDEVDDQSSTDLLPLRSCFKTGCLSCRQTGGSSGLQVPSTQEAAVGPIRWKPLSHS